MFVSFEGKSHIAAAFDDEEEAVVFLPASGDVLISSVESVSHLCDDTDVMPESAQELRKFLAHLGMDML